MKKSDHILVKQAIAELHKRESGDYQTLMRQVHAKQRVLRLNGPQMLATLSTAPTLHLEWGRGTGKTTIIGHRFREVARTMPRSTGLFIGPTYRLILTRILPSLIQGLEMFGLYEGLHYFVGQQPPRNWRQDWPKAYQPPRDYARYITFWNGTGAHLISQDVAGDGRGLNSDWIVGDEATMLTAEKLQENTDPTLRGTCTREFVRQPLFGSRLYASSTAITQEGQWFIAAEERAMVDPKKVNFIRADCRENLHNLRPGYLEDARASSLYDWLFQAEYLNVRPAQVRDGFYPLLNRDLHTYEVAVDPEQYRGDDCRSDADLVPGQPLIVSVDWGAAINCLTVNQHLRSISEYRTLKSMYVLGDDQETQDDLLLKFHRYYQYHDEKTIYMWYDNSGNHRTGITKLTRAGLAAKQLRDLGWKVHLMTVGGSNPHHEDKHVLWNIILSERDARYPRYRMNRHACRDLFISMSYARSLMASNGAVKKDKRDEKKKSVQRQHATDLSDANDTAIYGLFANMMRGVTSNPLPGHRAG